MRILKAICLCLTFLMIFSSCSLNDESGISFDSSNESYSDESQPDFPRYNFFCGINLMRRTEEGGYVPINTTILEYTGTPMEFVAATRVYDYEGCTLDLEKPVKMRLMLIQDGALLPHSLTDNGECSLFSDIEIMPSKDEDTYFPIYFTPYCYYEYSAVTVVCQYRPGNVPITGTMVNETLHYSKVIKTPANEQALSAVSVSSAADYVDIPEGLVGNENGVVGAAIGADMAKNHSYHVFDNLGMNDRLSLAADEIYLKVNYASFETMYAFVLCDGYPIKAFDGNYALAFDCEKGTKTLNRRIDLPPDINDGIHVLQAIIIQKNNNANEFTFSQTSSRAGIIIK